MRIKLIKLATLGKLKMNIKINTKIALLSMMVFLCETMLFVSISYSSQQCSALLGSDTSSFTNQAQGQPQESLESLTACNASNFCITSTNISNCIAKLNYFTSIANFYYQEGMQTINIPASILEQQKQTQPAHTPQQSNSNPTILPVSGGSLTVTNNGQNASSTDQEENEQSSANNNESSNFESIPEEQNSMYEGIIF